MADKRELTLKELEEQYNLVDEKRNVLKKQIEQKKREEEELREAQLAKEKDNRKKEVDDAFEKYKMLLKAYLNDYGAYYCTSESGCDLFSVKFWNDIV